MAYRSRLSSFRSLSTILIFFLFFFSCTVAEETCNVYVSNIIRTIKESNLDKCDHIVGDFYLDQDFEQTEISWNVKTITGCVYIEYTNLTNIDFLTSVAANCSKTHRISDNPNFCLNANQQDRIHWSLVCHKTSYEDCATITNWRTCGPLDCDQSYFNQSFGRAQVAPKCEIVKGGLYVNISSEREDQWVYSLSKVKEIHGGLTVVNHVAKDLSVFFPNLRLINLASSQNNTISIITDDEVDLKYFDLPSLERIQFAPETTAKFKFTIPSKSEFRISDHQRKLILKAMGPGGKVEVIGQKKAKGSRKQEKVQEKRLKSDDVDKAEEARKWMTFMFINCYLVFGFSVALYINCCDYGGEWAEERQEWEEEQRRRVEAQRLMKPRDAKEPKVEQKLKEEKEKPKEGKKGEEKEKKAAKAGVKGEAKKEK